MIYNVKEFAREIRASADWVRRNAESLGGRKVAGKWLFSQEALENLTRPLPHAVIAIPRATTAPADNPLRERLELERKRLKRAMAPYVDI